MLKGKGAVLREQSVLFILINGVWYPIGEDNESLTRTRNNNVTQRKNVLGKTKATVAKGNQITTVDPFMIDVDSALAAELYEIDKLDKQLDQLKYSFMEVSLFDEVEPQKYAAWKQEAIIDLKSWGGNNDGLYAPFDVVWTGDRTAGIYDQALNSFTPSGDIDTLTVKSTAGGEENTTIITVTPGIETGNHYRYKVGSTAEVVTANQDLSAWTPLAVASEISATGTTITVAEVDPAARAIRYGSTVIVYGT